jgi:hypothetical protein
MARSEARLQFGMWRTGLDGVSAHAKLLYAVLLTEPTVGHCGVGIIRLPRWATQASLTIVQTRAALEELIIGTQVVVDEDTDEIFVRTLIHDDRTAEQPYVLKGALKEAKLVVSAVIRRSLAEELRKLPARGPDKESKRGTRVTYADPHATATEIDSPAPATPPKPPQPPENPSETLFDADPSERVSKGSMQKGLEREGGGGGGVVNGSTTDGPVENTTVDRAKKSATTAKIKPAPTERTKIAQKIAKSYYDRVPLSNFPALMKIAKRALDSYPEPRVQAGFDRLAEHRRPVTISALLDVLEGPHLRPARPARSDVRVSTGLDIAARWEAEDNPSEFPPHPAIGGIA